MHFAREMHYVKLIRGQRMFKLYLEILQLLLFGCSSKLRQVIMKYRPWISCNVSRKKIHVKSVFNCKYMLKM